MARKIERHKRSEEVDDFGNLSDQQDVLGDLISDGVLSLESFTANPSATAPCGGPPVTLSWHIAIHRDRASEEELRILPQVRFELDVGIIPVVTQVNAIGSHVVQPMATTTYILYASIGVARIGKVRAELGTVTVTVSEGRCIRQSIPEDDIRRMVQDYFNTNYGPNNSEARLRAPVGLEIDTDGITLRLRLVKPGIVDIDIDVNARLLLPVQDCQARVMYAEFGVNANLPWWLELVAPVVIDIVEAFIGAHIEGELKPRLLQEVQRFLDDYFRQIPSILCLCRLRPLRDQIEVLACLRSSRLTPRTRVST
jgi:hypothetical protein